MKLLTEFDAVPWVREILGMTATPWQETFLRAPQGASILALTARQVGKTTTAFPLRTAVLDDQNHPRQGHTQQREASTASAPDIAVGPLTFWDFPDKE